MRPIALHGHSRAVTMVKYNREGDLLFSTSKDLFPTVWNAETGERLGTYNGHTGAVWACDVTTSSALFATAGADQTARIWDVETGEQLASIAVETPAKGVAWAHGDRHLACITDKVCVFPQIYSAQPHHTTPHHPTTTPPQSMGQTPAINIFNIPEKGEILSNRCEYNAHTRFQQPEVIKMCVWGPSNDSLYFCNEDGSVVIMDVETGKEKCFSLPHDGYEARRLSWDSDYSMLVSAGWDKTAKLLDGRDVSVVKTFKNDFNVNDAGIINNGVMNHVVMGGGLDAQSVTNAGSAQNKFDMKFCHKVFGDELGSIGGHFGPVNALAVEPNGHGFASGGEDGFVRLHHFDSDYYESPGNLKEFDLRK